MKYFKWVMIASITSIWVSVCSAQVYKWVDENGQTHYSATAPEKAQTLPIGGLVSSYKDIKYKDKISIYTKPTCKYCKEALAYFKKNKIAYREYDITKSKLAKRNYDQLNASGVPLIILGDKRMQGFSVERFEDKFEL